MIHFRWFILTKYFFFLLLQIQNIYKHIAVILFVTVFTCARNIEPSSTLTEATNENRQLESNSGSNYDQVLNRIRRQSYVPNDYYANYYNDYYNNYYNSIKNGPQNRPASADRFDGNSNNYNFNNNRGDDNTITSGGQKYVYTPIFQYKATHQKHQKLFVPNLFG